MKILQILFWTLWRIWFYVLVVVIILVLLPFLILSILKESWYPYFFKLARIWSKGILLGMGLYYQIKKTAPVVPNESYMLVANHTSMLDIMLMLIIFPENPFVFVGKKELAKFPLFGFFYKRTCILVDRGNAKSRHAVYKRAQERLSQGLSICIFPEGGVPDEIVVLDSFKDGAFRLAIEHQIPILPIVFYDNKKRFSFRFFSGSPGLMRAKILAPIPTKNLKLEDKVTLKENVRDLILEHLTEESF
jgi:1-acyl-sn-glycerol-3-phosphate acyltransferase